MTTPQTNVMPVGSTAHTATTTALVAAQTQDAQPVPTLDHYTEFCRGWVRAACTHYWLLGAELNEAKEQQPPKTFNKWLTETASPILHYSPEHLRRLMLIARELPQAQAEGMKVTLAFTTATEKKHAKNGKGKPRGSTAGKSDIMPVLAAAPAKAPEGEGKPEAKGEGKPEAKGEGKPEAKGEGKPEAKGEGKPEAKGEGKPEPEAPELGYDYYMGELQETYIYVKATYKHLAAIPMSPAEVKKVAKMFNDIRSAAADAAIAFEDAVP